MQQSNDFKPPQKNVNLTVGTLHRSSTIIPFREDERRFGRLPRHEQYGHESESQEASIDGQSE
ncbi:MAG: hypothetical protein AAFP90_19665 [Planctomycetota bacterium]